MELSELRREIDVIDGEITELVQRRMAVAAKIAQYKRENGLPVLDACREAEKLKRIAEDCGGEMGEYIARLYREMFAISRDYQQKLLERENG
jgi:monofunctional chorismate mutase